MLFGLIKKTELKNENFDFYYNKSKEKFKKYKLGQIIYVRSGINIGTEYSFNHYAIVVKSDNIAKGTINVVYLTSKRKSNGQIPLNNHISIYIYDSLIEELAILQQEIQSLDMFSNDYKNDLYSLTKKINQFILKTTNIKENISKADINSFVKLSNIAVISKNRILSSDNYRLNNATIPQNELKIIIEEIKKIHFHLMR